MASKPRLSVLTRRGDFLYLMKNGYRVRPSDWILFNYSLNNEGVMRCGWTLPRHVGSAVIRNRLKRWSRIYFRRILLNDECLPIDINLVFRKADGDFYKKLDYEGFSRVLDRGWRQIEQRMQRAR